MNSTNLIEAANKAHDRLKHKNYDRVSFTNGFFECFAHMLTKYESLQINGKFYTRDQIELALHRFDPPPVKGFCEYCMIVVEGRPDHDGMGTYCTTTECGRLASTYKFEKYKDGEKIKKQYGLGEERTIEDHVDGCGCSDCIGDTGWWCEKCQPYDREQNKIIFPGTYDKCHFCESKR
jgi:hypothetical protein